MPAKLGHQTIKPVSSASGQVATNSRALRTPPGVTITPSGAAYSVKLRLTLTC
jgi:hypothetical protein